MFRFGYPEYLWLMAIIPLLIGLYLLSRWLSVRAGRRFATGRALGRLLRDWSRTRSHLRAVMLFLALIFICMAMANPQWSARKEKVQVKASDVIIALDISNSMLAQDIAPSRLERSKRFASDLVQALSGDRIGLVLFAGYAYIQMPLTTDYGAALTFIRGVHPGLATTQGTDIGAAIEMAVRAYPPEDEYLRALVLITDGEDHEARALDNFVIAREAGILPFVVAAGTEEGAFIPVVLQGHEDYKRDEYGNPVRTRINEPFLQELATRGGGFAYNILDGEYVIQDIRNRIEAFEKRMTEQRSFTDFDSYYQYFLFPGVLLLILAWLTGERRSRERNQIPVG